MGKKRKKTHITEDQFGEGGVGQDKDFPPSRSGGAGSSKGGGGAHAGNPLQYVKHVPKFLQSHAHLLGQGNAVHGHHPHPHIGDGQIDDASDDDDDEGETEEEKRLALLHALEQNPALAKEYPELLELKTKRDAAQLKEKGNAAFMKNAYRDAIDLFSQCIDLDPTDHTYYSNRAAAYSRIEAWEDAIRDGRECVKRAPTWAKGYVRLGTALSQTSHGASEAVFVLEKAKSLDPDMQGIDELLAQARAKKNTVSKEKKIKTTKGPSLLLSFDDDEEEE